MDDVRTYTAVLQRSHGADIDVPGVAFTGNGLPQRTYGRTTILLNGNQLEETYELADPEEAGGARYRYRLTGSEEVGEENVFGESSFGESGF
ncbi:hypothetical protein ACFVWR_06035 [Leifsonia sp. NPDC058292]|uniref:hypothetical protein n=1 Tax=Leifsonia sp. NPDC058292 TaxID=3346428 RepID=UPI0036DA9708